MTRFSIAIVLVTLCLSGFIHAEARRNKERCQVNRIFRGEILPMEGDSLVASFFDEEQAKSQTLGICVYASLHSNEDDVRVYINGNARDPRHLRVPLSDCAQYICMDRFDDSNYWELAEALGVKKRQ